VEELGEGDDKFSLRRKIKGHGADGFIAPPMDGVLRICVALKNPPPRPGLNPQTLSPMASTLTMTPQRRQEQNIWTTSVRVELSLKAARKRYCYYVINITGFNIYRSHEE
jgi:hypothetical protein